jgi:hypothetical protein
MSKLSKKERKRAFKKLEGWLYTKAVAQDASPDSTRNLNYFNVLKLTYIDPKGEFALYKCIQLTPFEGTTIGYQLIMQVAIASYDEAVDDQMRLEVVNNDGQTMAGCSGNGKTFSGRQTRQTRMSTSTSTNGDSFDGFTYVSGFTLKKLKHIPEFFQDFRFDTIYNELFKLFNNNNNNNNDLDNITLDSIATEQNQLQTFGLLIKM